MITFDYVYPILARTKKEEEADGREREKEPGNISLLDIPLSLSLSLLPRHCYLSYPPLSDRRPNDCWRPRVWPRTRVHSPSPSSAAASDLSRLRLRDGDDGLVEDGTTNTTSSATEAGKGGRGRERERELSIPNACGRVGLLLRSHNADWIFCVSKSGKVHWEPCSNDEGLRDFLSKGNIFGQERARRERGSINDLVYYRNSAAKRATKGLLLQR